MMCDSRVASLSCPDLLDGIAVFIDDEINDDASSAGRLKKQIQEKNIPLIASDKIPDNIPEFVKHLYGVSFIILDWKFSPIPSPLITEGVHLPDDFESAVAIEFLKALLDATYCPIFILSQEDVASIKRKLDDVLITSHGRHPRIFVNSKNDLLNGKLFSSLNDWVENKPVTYVLKTWENAAKEAKLKAFAALEKKHASWPRVLWKAFKDDRTNPSHSLTETLCNIFTNNLIANCLFLPQKIESNDYVSAEDIRAVLEAERFMSVSESMPPAPGDIFRTENEGYYLLNIRAQCNLLHIDNPELYCIRGTILDESKILKDSRGGMNNDDNVLFFKGQLHGHEDIIYVPFILENKILAIDFKHFKIKEYCKIKSQRIGRLLPPFITKVQQLFSAYMVREGLPAIPDEAIAESTPPPSPSAETGD